MHQEPTPVLAIEVLQHPHSVQLCRHASGCPR